MVPVPSRLQRWTRRAFLSTLASIGLGAENGKGAVFSLDWRRFPDPATEFEVYRLTDPKYSSFLPADYARFLSHKNQFLLFWSDRTGSPQAFRMDLKSGECRQLTDAEALDGSSITLLPDERSFCYFDGPSLRQMNLASLKQREIYRIPEGAERTAGGSVAEDGSSAFFGEKREEAVRLRMVGIARGSAKTLSEGLASASHPLARPRRAQVMYRSDNGLWLVDLDGGQKRRLKLAEGGLGPARWSPDGKTILYLHYPTEKTQLHAIREHTPDQNQDRLISKTSQFVHFDCNGNSSVFVGASQNRNSPHILILLRLTRRELTLCEHRASDPAMVSPRFSQDSQRIFFVSDKHGKPAIYRIQVERFVEKTDEET